MKKPESNLPIQTIPEKNYPVSYSDSDRPQQSGQSNLTPAQGAELWQQYIEPLKAQGVRPGSPATSSAPSGKTWIQDWLSACAGQCNPDFIALREYLSVDPDHDILPGPLLNIVYLWYTCRLVRCEWYPVQGVSTRLLRYISKASMGDRMGVPGR